MKNIDEFVEGKRVLITGGTGSLGNELIKHMTKAEYVRILSRDEKKQLDMKRRYSNYLFDYRLGDVRNYYSVRDAVRDINIIIHGASLKYVDISELQPDEYVSVNVVGTQNLINAVLAEGSVEKCIGISTDKACAPINTYGLTKAILEKLFIEAETRRQSNCETTFVVARYGNVVGTRGSVVPRWAELRKQNKPLQVTDPDMTRFFFTLKEAVDLIGYALQSAGGTIVSKKMSSCTLGELAYAMQTAGVHTVGPRPGEKKHEMLISSDESFRTTTDGDKFLLHPRVVNNDAWKHGGAYYGSDNANRLSHDELVNLLQEFL